jgi:fructose-1-phosphate kinase PfkB-like protein
MGIDAESVDRREPSRVNLEIIDDDGAVTEILEPGGTVSPSELTLFRTSCERAFAQASGDSYAIFSASLPPGASQGFYAELICAARGAGAAPFWIQVVPRWKRRWGADQTSSSPTGKRRSS